MEIKSPCFNNFEEKFKAVDIDSIENDSQTYDRQYLEFLERYDQRVQSEYDMFLREFDLANNYPDEMDRRVKIENIARDAEAHMDVISKKFVNELAELQEKYEKKTTYPFYHKWMFIGDTKDYKNLLNGLSYYIKVISETKIQVYYDVKFSEYLGEFDYVFDDWKEII